MIVTRDYAGVQHFFEEILDIDCHWNLGSPVAELTVRVLADEMPPELYALAWEENGRYIFVGVCDVQRIVAGKDGIILTLKGRTAGLYLLDNEALPAAYYNVYFADIALRYIGTYGIYDVDLGGNGACLPAFVVQKGMSDWEVVSEFCKRAYGKYPYLTSENELRLLPHQGSRRHIISNKSPDGLRFLQCEQTIDRSGLVSKVIIRDKQGAYPTWVQNPENEALKIRRKRYFAPRGEYAATQNADAYAIIRSSMAKKQRAKIVLEAVQEVTVGDIVTVEAGAFYKGEMLVTDVRCLVDESGSRTELLLMENAFADCFFGGK